MKKGNVLYLFGKEFNKQLENTDVRERYLKIRIERFKEEFLNADVAFDDIDDILHALEEYLENCSEHPYLYNTIYNLRESIWWLQLYAEVEIE